MKHCAVCGRVIHCNVGDLCQKCKKDYGDTDWAKALIEIEEHNRYYERERNRVVITMLSHESPVLKV